MIDEMQIVSERDKLKMPVIGERDKLKTYFYEWHPYLDLMFWIGVCTIPIFGIGLAVLVIWAIARITVLLMSTSGDEILYDRVLRLRDGGHRFDQLFRFKQGYSRKLVRRNNRGRAVDNTDCVHKKVRLFRRRTTEKRSRKTSFGDHSFG